MKQLLFILTLSFNLQINAQQKVHTNDQGDEISLPSNWSSTLVGKLFYNADFVLTDDQNKNMLILQFLPKDFILSSNDIDLNSDELKQKLLQLNKVSADDLFLYEDEVILSNNSHSSEQAKGILFTTKYQGNNSINSSWIGAINQNTVFIKLISKQNQIDESMNLVPFLETLNYKKANIDKTNLKLNQYPFGFKLHLYADINEDLNLFDKYPYLNYAFTEKDRRSQYSISSQCSDIQVPEELLTQIIMQDFGHENSYFNNYIYHDGSKYYTTLGFYSNSNGSFNTITAVINANKCQHLLTYITDESDPITARFLKFLDHFEIDESNLDIIDSSLSDQQNNKYFSLLNAIADSYYSLEVYKKSEFLYQLALNYKLSIDTFDSLLLSNYKLGKHLHGMELIEKYSSTFKSVDIDAWHAWFLSKTDQPEASVQLFKKVFDQEYTSDEDLFKYLDQFTKLEDYKSLIEVANKFIIDAEDKSLVKLKIAQAYIKSDKNKAREFIKDLFKENKVIHKYQFELLDGLADIKEYQLVIDYAQTQLNKGLESALLLNYMGDAYNKLGDIETAYELMQKSHHLAPDNRTIESYYKSLQKKVGKSNIASISKEISAVKLPKDIETKIQSITPINSASSYEYLYNVSAYFHEKGLKNKNTNYTKIKINNESGVAKNTTIQIAFDQEYENIFINYFRVFDENNQLITELDKSTTYITTDNDGITADGDKLINIPVPSLAIGVSIEWAITIENNEIDATQNFVEKIFVSSVNNQYKAIVLRGDIDTIKYASSQDLIAHKISDNLIYWEYQDLPNYKKTPYLPEFQKIFPWLKFSSVKESWITLGDEYFQDINDKINSDLSNEFKIGFFSELDDETQKAKKIIHFVQNQISYQALEFGWRAFVPNKSAKTLKNKYGDCKDHAVLLYDLLNSNGIKAQLALVNSKNDIAIQLPSFGQFDHMIVYLPEIDEGVFVDVTDKDSSLILVNPPYSLQDHHALVLEPNNSKLIQIPQISAAYNSLNITRTVEKQHNTYIYHESAEIHGHFAASFRAYLKEIELDELESRILAWTNNYYSDLILDQFKYHNLYDTSKPLVLEFTFKQDVSEASVKLPVFLERYAMEFSKSPNRNWDFDYKAAFEIQSVTTIENSKSLKFKKANIELDNQLLNWEINSNGKRIEFNSQVFNNNLPASDYNVLVKSSRKSYKTLETLLK